MMRRQASGGSMNHSVDDMEDPQLMEDDNAAPPDMASETELDERQLEDPLEVAIDDFEGRIVSVLDDVKLHPGDRSSPDGPTVHEELATLLRPVLEIAAHSGPSVARTYASYRPRGIEQTCEEIYNRLNSDLILPVLKDMAETDRSPAKRAASLVFFHQLWKECHAAGSWLDNTTTGPHAGPYGPGGMSPVALNMTPAQRQVAKRRQGIRLSREGELLLYWVAASTANTVPGAFTSDKSENAIASRGVIAASASLRPSLRHIAQLIKDAGDRGAEKIYKPVMKMIEGVLRKLFVQVDNQEDSLRSACIKFLEIVVLCCSSKLRPGTPAQGSSRRHSQKAQTEDFALEDLPPGHPTITKESLEEIGEQAFITLRGLTTVGGQVKIDVNLMTEMIHTIGSGSQYGGVSSVTAPILSILKTAALAYLEVENVAVSNSNKENPLEFKIDRQSIDFDFGLSQKSYSLSINAVAMLAVTRPVFYKEAVTCLARRAVDPPIFVPSLLTKAAAKGLASHLRASCLTLLRNPLSVTTNGCTVLQAALKELDMAVQAEKALNMARQAASLRTADRATRNRAAIFYQWDSSEVDKRVTKRQREADDALAQMRKAKAARGLGSGIQLPTNMTDAVELVLLNLKHKPRTRPTGSAAAEKNRKTPFTLDYLVEAVLTNGASLAQDEGRWYDRDGGSAWVVQMDSENESFHFSLAKKTSDVMQKEEGKTHEEEESVKREEQRKLFSSQCEVASSDAFARIVANSASARTKGLGDFGHRVAARLAWTFGNVKPSSQLKAAREAVEEGTLIAAKRGQEENILDSFVGEFPLVSSCLVSGMVPNADNAALQPDSVPDVNISLANRILSEAYVRKKGRDSEDGKASEYDQSLDVFVATVVHASERANVKPGDNEKKQIATTVASSLPQQIAVLPSVTPSALKIACGLCDIDEITKKAAEAARKSSQQTLATSATIHAAKVAAEKRATAALLVLRDIAFRRSNPEVRRGAVDCAVGIAAGRLKASASIEEKALKLVMNVLFPKCPALADAVVESATAELERAASYAIENHDKISEANAAAKPGDQKRNAAAPASEEEKAALEKVKKPAVLFMALCVRRPDIVKKLMSISCQEKANVLAKAVRNNMPKLARAASTKHGAAAIALKVSEMASEDETPMLLAFLDNMSSTTENALPSEELIEACHTIQETRSKPDGKKDARFLIPVVSGMKRADIVSKMHEFVAADDKIFMAALVKMNERLGRHALLYRDEPDQENPSLHGITLCEQVVFLHKLDFASVGLPQKRYLDVIRLCLEEDEIFSDRVIMAALDRISSTFVAGEEGLPLAYMRTIILTCSKHESLHSWICHVLLPRLVEGKVYTDRRQWEGWMRCAKMLENTGDGGVSSLDAINKLPAEQLSMYRAKYPVKS